MTEAGLADIRNLKRLASERDTLLDELKTAFAQFADAKREDSYVKGSSSTLLAARF